ncbi:hypothetical protein [Goodfellowiella coeruleoviolacea]|uniref:Uncharacterized protein n=1 Tax=Goodfellowiella coeruleoviolacea TaxID=334858 RepID=A0AAE3KH68_9PSEU|nr:hypothetical protein [Goodfellowiella coeruleoviolacea]MCP2167000.1 hypothetical protein [Goodfellowiella coeruleoviolacea]
MIPGVRYSEAPRCGVCGHRALLTREAAHALVLESFGRLELFTCPYADNGWHVWAPHLESRRVPEPGR